VRSRRTTPAPSIRRRMDCLPSVRNANAFLVIRRVGTASWTGPSLVESDLFYLCSVRNRGGTAALLCERFNTVEVDFDAPREMLGTRKAILLGPLFGWLSNLGLQARASIPMNTPSASPFVRARQIPRPEYQRLADCTRKFIHRPSVDQEATARSSLTDAALRSRANREPCTSTIG
jgi:hypothetical protein